jgi:hypothetical protein
VVGGAFAGQPQIDEFDRVGAVEAPDKPDLS